MKVFDLFWIGSIDQIRQIESRQIKAGQFSVFSANYKFFLCLYPLLLKIPQNKLIIHESGSKYTHHYCLLPAPAQFLFSIKCIIFESAPWTINNLIRVACMKADLISALNPLTQIFLNLPNKSHDQSNNSTQNTVNKLPQGTKIIGNYLLGKNIGQGTFGKVHLALHIPTSEKVAVKIIDKSKMRPKDVARVKSEIQILKTIRHRHVLNLYEIIETEKSVLLITEHMPNGQLFRHIIKQKKIAEDEACSYFQQIIEAVQYLHRNKIAHRDLKPENILIDYDRQLKIIDFGLSSFYDNKTELKTFCGSPCYAAPELVEAKRGYNPVAADLWSCGVILYAMLCGHLPFCDADTHTLFKKIMSCNYKIPSHISPEARDLLSNLLVLSPEKRLSLESIKDHRWFNRINSANSYGLDRGQQLQVDESILSRMKSMGIMVQNLSDRGILNNEKSKDMATYFILMKKLIKGGDLIPSYIGNENFNPKLIIRTEEKVGDEQDTESYNDPQMVNIQTPEAPEIPQMSEQKQSMAGFDQWWYLNHTEEEIRDIDENELMLLANGILDLFLPKNNAINPEIQKISELLTSERTQNPKRNIVIQKREQQFYDNNKGHGKKKLEIRPIQQNLKDSKKKSSLNEISSNKAIKISLMKFQHQPQFRRSLAKREQTEPRQFKLKEAEEAINVAIITPKIKKEREAEKQRRSKIDKKIDIALPNICQKVDRKEIKMQSIAKKYKLYRAFIH